MAIKKLLAKLAYVPVLGRLLLIPYRFFTTFKLASKPTRYYVKWLFTSREYTNFTYALSQQNINYLAAFVSDVSNISIEKASEYIKEVQNDSALKSHIQHAIKKGKKGLFADKKIYFGRRLGWYAIVRAKKPKIIIETGVDKGMGSVLLTAALEKNANEGDKGFYYGTDINPNAGFYLSGDYAKYGKIVYGDSIQSLHALDVKVDIFINDSDHSADYEAKEYQAIAGKLTKDAIIIGDNADVTDKLYEFAVQTGRRFMFFKEDTYKHWHPGAAIGIALSQKN